MLLNYDQDNSNIFIRQDVGKKEQLEYAGTRFAIRNIAGHDELFFFRLKNKFRGDTSLGECGGLYDHFVREFEYSAKYWEIHMDKKRYYLNL